MLELPGTEDWLERIALVAGRPLAEKMIFVQSRSGAVRLSGYVAHPSQSRANNRMQYLFLNGRAIRDRSLQHAMSEAYRGLLMTGRFPIVFLALEMPPELVDVNVHPTKLEVRFQDSGQLYSQLLSTLRTKFLSTDLSTRVETPPDEDPTGAHDSEQAAQFRQRVVDWAKGKTESWTADRPSSEGGDLGFVPSTPQPGEAVRSPLELRRLDRAWATGSEDAAGEPSPHHMANPSASVAGPNKTNHALQIHNRYLVAESEDGIMVIDQHALHERILYEQLKARVASGPVESQALLVPEPVDLNPSEVAVALENRETLSRLGLKIEPFGGDTLLISSYPAMLANMNPAEVLHALLEPLISGGKTPDQRDAMDELLHTIACKAAIKAGDRLVPEEISALLEQRWLIDDPHHCPHGRPTALIFSREELDKQFKRI